MATPLYVFANSTTNSGNELWIAGAGLTAPRLLKDIVPGSGNSSPDQFTSLADGRVLFTAPDGFNGFELWVTDGTEAGTWVLVDTNFNGSVSGPEKLTALPNGKVLFTADNGQSGRELWVTDGTAEGTQLVKDIQAGSAASQISDFAVLPNGRALFSANDGVHGLRLWSTDGTAAGTQLLQPVDAPERFTLGGIEVSYEGDRALVSTDKGNFTTDGTAEGTTGLTSFLNRGFADLEYHAIEGGRWVFAGYDPTKGYENEKSLYVTDGTTEGTIKLLSPQEQVIGGRFSGETKITELGNGKVVVQGLHDLYVTDGTKEGTGVIGDDILGQHWATDFVSLGDGRALILNLNKAYETYQATAADLWVTDGTEEGTIRIADNQSWVPGSLPSEVNILSDGSVIFSAASLDGDRFAVWKFDLVTNALERLENVQARGNSAIDVGVLQPVCVDPEPPVDPQPLEQVQGTSASDTFDHRSGSYAYMGGSGHDVLNMGAMGWRGGSLSAQFNGTTLMNLGSSADVLSSIEEVQFADGRLVFDAADPAAQVVRLYQAALHRAPEQHGLDFWIEQISDGAPLSRLASGFLDSAEFTSRYGTDLSTAGYVEALYNNALGRGSDAAGKAHWVNLIDSGAMSRAEVLAGFSESAENQIQTSGLIQAGIWDVSENAAFVARLYDTALGRLPDVQGLDAWRAQLDAGTITAADMANGFAASDEFAARYGTNVSTSAFVELLYVNTLDRASDAAGKANWVNVIDGGVMSRADVVLGFSESAEHVAQTAPGIMSEDPSHFGIVFA
jgi:ELWxxDGT repeat protein